MQSMQVMGRLGALYVNWKGNEMQFESFTLTTIAHQHEKYQIVSYFDNEPWYFTIDNRGEIPNWILHRKPWETRRYFVIQPANHWSEEELFPMLVQAAEKIKVWLGMLPAEFPDRTHPPTLAQKGVLTMLRDQFLIKSPRNFWAREDGRQVYAPTAKACLEQLWLMPAFNFQLSTYYILTRMGEILVRSS